MNWTGLTMAQTVVIAMKRRTPTQVHNVNTAGNSPNIKGAQPQNQNKKTIFATAENDVNTDRM